MHIRTRPGCSVSVVTIVCMAVAVAGVPLVATAGPMAPLAPSEFNVAPPQQPVRLIFIHHSTGEAWLADDHGGLGTALRDSHYFVSDTNYGWTAGGDVIGDRTDIGHWWEWFAGPTRDTVMAALYSEGRQHSGYSRLPVPPAGPNQIVMFKSCFPNSHLAGHPDDPPTTGANPLRGKDASSEHLTVANAKGIYNDILDYFASQQATLFVVAVAPPLRSEDTSPAAAANARAFTTWLVQQWLSEYPYRNVMVFDLFTVLTSNGGNPDNHDLGWTSGNHHRFRNGTVEHITDQGSDVLAYPTWDSHPSAAGGQKATGEYVPLLNIAYNCWQGLGGCPGVADPCTISCTTSVPANAQAGTAVMFQANVTATTCTGETTFAWHFGDGSMPAASQTAFHAFPTPGTYSWSFSAANGAVSCAAEGVITVTAPPVAGHPIRRRLQRPAPAGSRLQPGDLRYVGAFRLPDPIDGAPEAATWEYGGEALAYRPDGDADGPSDGFPGSLIGTGLDQVSLVSEISIPAPALSPAKDPADLPMATTLQPFADVRGSLFAHFLEIPRLGLCVLTDTQTGEKLHMGWGQHFQEDQAVQSPSHGWSDLTLATPATRGAWWIGDWTLYSVNGYIFEIPDAWAGAHVGGRRLATGRHRDGGWSGMGPSLFAYAPWLSGNPPPPGTRLNAVPLLLYSSTRDDDPGSANNRMNGYQFFDEWEGGAWITTPEGRSAVVFAGTKGIGEYVWYGWADPTGTAVPCVEMETGGQPMCYRADGEPCPAELVQECEGHTSYRGWWSSSATARLVFYDPADLALVAAGVIQPHVPQPYAHLDLDPWLFLPDPPVEPEMLGPGAQRRYRLGETAYDRARGRLFILERFADGSKPVVHVWQVQ